MPLSRLPIFGSVLIVLFVAAWVAALLVFRIGRDMVGATPSGPRLERVKQSHNYRDGEFVNIEPIHRSGAENYWTALTTYLFPEKNRRPTEPLPTSQVDLTVLADSSKTQVVWLGHSTVFARIGGVTILTDPVFENSVPLLVGSTRRFQPSPLALGSMPLVDAVIISHDHYDHLEMSTVEYLAAKGATFITPLGVGAHLEEWGVPVNQIIELDWWDTVAFRSLQIACTPARHFSGRRLFSLNKTLWASWVIADSGRRLFYSGDTGPGRHFEQIADRFGPIDLAIMQIGAYGNDWPDIHLTPEQALFASDVLNAKQLLPVHWGTFDLALHPWVEPIQRLVRASPQQDVKILTPRPGDILDLDRETACPQWWRGLE